MATGHFAGDLSPVQLFQPREGGLPLENMVLLLATLEAAGVRTPH